MIGVPAATDIRFLFELLAHLGDVWIPVHRPEERVDIDFFEAVGEGDMSRLGRMLVAEENHTVLGQRLAHGAIIHLRQGLGQIDAVDNRAHQRSDTVDYQVVLHGVPSSTPPHYPTGDGALAGVSRARVPPLRAKSTKSVR